MEFASSEDPQDAHREPRAKPAASDLHGNGVEFSRCGSYQRYGDGDGDRDFRIDPSVDGRNGLELRGEWLHAQRRFRPRRGLSGVYGDGERFGHPTSTTAALADRF